MTPGRRSNRGGPRTGTPGQTYTNRSDLNAHQPVTTAPGQIYGAATQQADAQRQMPLPGPGLAAQAPLGPGGPSGPLPGSLGALHDPTQRPDEPVTHGLPSGPGAGPEVLGGQPDPTVNVLRGLYAAFPTPDVAALLNEAYARARQSGTA